MFYFARPDVTGLPIADLVEGKVFFEAGRLEMPWERSRQKDLVQGRRKKIEAGHLEMPWERSSGGKRERGGRAADD